MIRPSVLLLALTLPAASLAQDLTAHGDFRHMMHTGESAGTVALDGLDVPGAWGIGALAGLRGEIVIMDGRVLVSRGDDPEARLTAPQAEEEAAILVYGQVPDWQSVTLPHDMTPQQLAMFLGHQGGALGLDLEAGFPIRLQGNFPTLVWHVVTGEAPMQGHGIGHGAGHANSQSGMVLFDEAGAAGEIVGVYTGAALEGVASHPGERLHLHFVSEGGARSGHVDEVAFTAGTTLLVPVAGHGAKPEPAVHSAAMQGAEGHDPAMHDISGGPALELREGGQSAFAAIQEVVSTLIADPATDWSKVDIEALRLHLVDMDNVTLRADVTREDIQGGARFVVTSADPAVTASIRAMVPAHVATMNGVEGWDMQADEVEGGAVLTVIGSDADRIRGLGFIGLMTVGMHHQAHHMALAKGQNPHDH